MSHTTMVSFRAAGALHSERKPKIRDLGTFTEDFEELDSNTPENLLTIPLCKVKSSARVPLSSDSFDLF